MFANGATIEGSIDGGTSSKSIDTLNYAAYTSPVTVNLATNVATGVNGGAAGGIVHIEKMIGGSAADMLIGPNTANVWKITANNAGTVGGFAFSSVKNLAGGALADRFILSKGMGVSGHVDGGGGNNTLDYSAYTSAV